MTAPDPRLRILVVDDEPFTLKALQRLLRQHEVDLASSGREALRRFAEGASYDVIVCDVMMPELTGVDVYRALAEHYPGTENRIVFVSGGAFGGEIIDFIERVENPLVAKPFDRDELRDTVMRVAEAQRPKDDT